MENKLLTQELAEAISIKEGLTKKKSEAFIKALFETIEEGLVTDKFVKIKGFGTFKIISVGERESVNINTGERFSIEGHEKITFTPDTLLKDLINRPFAHFQTVIINEETDINELEQIDKMMTDSEEVSSNIQLEEKLETSPLPATQIAEDSTRPIDSMTFQTEAKKAGDKENSENQEVENNENISTITETLPPQLSIKSNSERTEANPNNKDEEAIAEDTNESTIPATANSTFSATQHTESTKEEPNINDKSFSLEEEKEEECTRNKNERKEDDIKSLTSPGSAEHHEGEFEQEQIRYIIEELEGKRNTWKTISMILLAILLLMLSYFAGYFRWFCPCELELKDNEPFKVEKTSESNSSTISQDTITNEDSIVVSTGTNIHPYSKQDTIHHPEQHRPNGEIPPQSPQPSATQQPKEEKHLYKQIDGGKYKIVGTIKKHEIKRGETIRTIALDIYGSKGYAPYIIIHNNIIEPNNIECGTIIKLPRLEKRK